MSLSVDSSVASTSFQKAKPTVVAVVPNKTSKPTGDVVDIKGKDKKAKNGKGGKVALSLITAGSVVAALIYRGKAKNAVAALEEAATKLANETKVSNKLKQVVQELEGRGFFKRIFKSNKKHI